MPDYQEYTSLNILPLNADETIKSLKYHVDDAKNAGWDKMYITTEEYGGLSIMGIKPPDPKAIAAAKEKRRKQFERLKKEFEGD